MNDWGSRYGLWDEGGAYYPDNHLKLPRQLIVRMERQSEVFHKHFSADNGKWESDSVRLQHREEVIDIAAQLGRHLAGNVELTHVPWEHGLKPYVVKTPLPKINRMKNK